MNCRVIYASFHCTDAMAFKLIIQQFIHRYKSIASGFEVAQGRLVERQSWLLMDIMHEDNRTLV